MYTIEILDAAGQVKQTVSGTESARLYYAQEFVEGDRIVFTADDHHCAVQVDATLPEALVYLTHKQFSFAIPFGDLKTMYAPQAFSGSSHIISLRAARLEEVFSRRNLAINPADQRFYKGCYPHATANIETRDEPVFFARNVIDGLKFNTSHGGWPYLSWGIGGKDDAEINVHFGRAVLIDEVGITIRADFPHDTWWEKATLSFSDGQECALSLTKTGETQYFPIGEHEVTWVKLCSLIRADDPSPFPALTQLEVFGMDIA